MFPYVSPYQSVCKSNSEKCPSRKGETNDYSYINMTNTTLKSSSVRDVNAVPQLLTPLSDLLLDLQGNKHPLVQNGKLMLAAWKVTGNPLRWKEFQAIQLSLYPSEEDGVLLQVTNRLGISGLADVLEKKLIHFVYL